MKDNHKLTTIALIIANLPPTLWGFARQCAIYVRSRTFHTSTGHIPYFAWHVKKVDYNTIKIWGTTGVMLDSNSKLTPNSIKAAWVGHGNYEMTNLCCVLFTQKIVHTPHFRLDSSHCTILSRSLSSSCRKIMGNIQVSDVHDLKLKIEDGPFNSSEVSHFILRLPKNH